MRFFFFYFVFTSLLHAQISIVRQTIENNRIIITYDLSGSDKGVYDIKVTATNESGEIITPRAIVGDINAITPGKDRSIWWETQLEGLTSAGWKINLTAKKGIGINWVFVKGGPNGDFSISATEVTFEQFDSFCIETGYKRPSENFGRGKQPVININVADAQAFCNWLSKEIGITVRLPEESEWVYAAQGGNKSNKYLYSGSNSIDEVAWYGGNSGNKAHEVATKKSNELGIYDMSGNVWEWCGTSGALRGGSGYYDYGCRVSARSDNSPNDRYYSYGFRVLRKW